MRISRLTLSLLCGTLFAHTLFARDVFVMLSGGSSPMVNNYSQYLQAKAVARHFEKNYPSNSVWVFFGAGNVEGAPPVFADVRRQMKRNGFLVNSWLPGSIRGNRPATREVVLRAMREEILPAVRNGGRLFLIVGDHGSRTPGENRESVIDLWGMKRDAQNERGWRLVENQSLSVSELGRLLDEGMGTGRLVFCMTQCHAGGFHDLAVPRMMRPNPKWFKSLAGGVEGKQTNEFRMAAGFTATDELSLAAGCDPAPDPDTWAGYERFFPERLLGVDLFTGERTGRGSRTFAEAHAGATLIDRTIDKPYATSEQYLERWASLIETRLAKEQNLVRDVQKAVAAFERTVNGAKPRVANRAFRERQVLFQRFIDAMCGEQGTNFLKVAMRADLERAIDLAGKHGGNPFRRPGSEEFGEEGEGGRRRGGTAESRRLWNEILRPAWKAAVVANRISNAPPAAMVFEKYLLAREAGGRDYFFRNADELGEEVFWRSGYSNPRTYDPGKAEAIADWAAARRARILEWGEGADDEKVRNAAEQIVKNRRGRQPDSGGQDGVPLELDGSEGAGAQKLSASTAAERVLFYRRVLAAWEFLIAVNERPALARLRELIRLERMELPRT